MLLVRNQGKKLDQIENVTGTDEIQELWYPLSVYGEDKKSQNTHKLPIMSKI